MKQLTRNIKSTLFKFYLRSLEQRLFWLICLLICSLGAYSLISQYQNDFESKSVSIVYESLLPQDVIEFPSIAICDVHWNMEPNELIIEYIEKTGTEYIFDVESVYIALLYPQEYKMKESCIVYENCKNCTRCPKDKLREIAEATFFNCTAFFIKCQFGKKVIDCCQYFLPMLTSKGYCFLMNSLLNNDPSSEHWLHLSLSAVNRTDGFLTFIVRRPFTFTVINAEDIPTQSLQNNVEQKVRDVGTNKRFYITSITTINDPDVRLIPPEYRNCRFPDEVPYGSTYKAYSFSTCITECIRTIQHKYCNCTMYSYTPHPLKDIPDCNLNGIYCLEKYSMIETDIKKFLPWTNPNEYCDCLPSCAENDFHNFYTKPLPNIEIPGEKNARMLTLGMPFIPKVRYRRQALRTRLDIIVTIGGILGLFLGASVLSGIEFLYYFTIRLYTFLKNA